MRKLSVRATVVWLGACTALFLLGGCATASEGVPKASGASSEEVPTFTGPWAAEFAENYRETDDETARTILAKESITDADYSEISDTFVACMAAKNFTVTIDDEYGAFTVTNSFDGEDPVLKAAYTACTSGFNAVSGLRAQMLRNPERLDENTIVAACLVKKGLVDPGYTAKDYARDLEDWSFPFGHDSMKAGECFSDPLELNNRAG